MRHLSTLTSFGPSSQVCELAGEFCEEKSANRLIKSISSPITAEELDEFSFWLTETDLYVLAEKNHIRINEYGFVVTAKMEAEEREFQEMLRQAEEEDKQMQEEWARIEAENLARQEEELLMMRMVLHIARKHRRERWARMKKKKER